MRYWDGARWIEPPADAATTGTPTAATVDANHAATPEPAKKKGLRWWGWTLIIVGAVIILLIIGAITGSGRDNDAAPAPANSTSASDGDPSAEPVEEPSEEPSPEPEPEEPVMEPQVFEGSGDNVIEVEITEPATVAFDCPVCDGNTVLETNGSESLLVNEIGAYSGTKLINVRDGSMVTRFTVTATGAWTITVDSIQNAPTFDGAASGTGDQVFWMLADFDVADISNDGGGNFVVQAYGDANGFPLIVNEIGAYSGGVEMGGPSLVEVTSTGAWTITPR